METNDERRLRKLKELVTAKGLDDVAEPAGLKPVYLQQIIRGVLLPHKKGGGPRSARSLGDPAARALEKAHGLGRGWFDNDEGEAMLSPDELRLIGYFRDLDRDAQASLLKTLHKDREERQKLRLQLMRGVSVAVNERSRPDGTLAAAGAGAAFGSASTPSRKRGRK